MDRAQVIAILNELLTLEQRSLSLRLLEATVSVSSLSVPALVLVQRMTAATRDHGAALANLILDLGGTPAPRHYLIATADLHFQDLHHVLPRLVADQVAVVRSYTLAAQRLSDDPRALALVNRILQQHQQQLQALSELSPVAKKAAM
ncbi:MAG: hypothetical protein AAB385_03410 [Planctomycetota bacterium]